MSKLIVSKDNQLISASYELSISEQRVILLCIAKIDSRKPVPNNYEVTISVDDMAGEMGVAKENAYRDLKKAFNMLYGRTIYIDPNDPDSQMRWIYKKVYFKATGVAVISFSPDILKFLFELKERFTTYKLKNVSKFKCSYSIRFYELLIQFKGNNKLKVDVAWLRTALQLGDKYPRTSDIKKYIVIPSINDINEFSNLKVTFEQVKLGREISHFIFHYSFKKGVNDNNNPTKLTDKYVSDHARPGESWADARKRLSLQLKGE